MVRFKITVLRMLLHFFGKSMLIIYKIIAKIVWKKDNTTVKLKDTYKTENTRPYCTFTVR